MILTPKTSIWSSLLLRLYTITMGLFSRSSCDLSLLLLIPTSRHSRRYEPIATKSIPHAALTTLVVRLRGCVNLFFLLFLFQAGCQENPSSFKTSLDRVSITILLEYSWYFMLRCYIVLRKSANQLDKLPSFNRTKERWRTALAIILIKSPPFSIGWSVTLQYRKSLEEWLSSFPCMKPTTKILGLETIRISPQPREILKFKPRRVSTATWKSCNISPCNFGPQLGFLEQNVGSGIPDPVECIIN